jgi:DNA-binding response OmpR family regulator
MKVFIVEDQRKLGVLLEQGLVEAGHAVGYADR